jgi:hypothetical protein
MSLSDQHPGANAIRLSASFPGAARPVRKGEPFTVGVPLPRGRFVPSQAWSIVGPEGSRRSVQTRALDCWSDGSVRWLLVDGNADLSPELQSVHLIPTTGEVRDVPAIGVMRSGDGVWIDTGAARFHIEPGPHLPFSDVTIGSLPVLDRSQSGFFVEDENGVRCATEVNSVSLEVTGPRRACALIRGAVRRNRDEFLEMELRAHFFAGLPAVRLLVTLRNPRAAVHPDGFWDLGDPGSLFVRDVSLTLALASDSGPAAIRCSPEAGASWESFVSSVEIYQDSSGGENWRSTNHVNRRGVVPNAFRGYRMVADGGERIGKRATPIVAIDVGGKHVAAVLPAFWQNFPKAIGASGRALTVGFFPKQYGDVHEIQGGEQKTHECFFSFGADGVTAEPLEWCRVRPRWYADPVWCYSTAAIPFLSEIDPIHGCLISTAIEGPDSFEHKREVVDEYGWRHFGEVYGDHEAVRHTGPMPLVSHYNNQYDTVAGFFYQFARTGDHRWGTLMADLAAHVVDIDIYHTTRDKAAYNHGLFWHTYHYGDAGTATHRTYPRSDRGRTGGGGPSADHNYTTGLMLFYFLTGDEACRETVVNSAEYVISIDDGRRTQLRWLSTADTGGATASADRGAYHGPGRGPADSLNALIDGHRLTGDLRFLRKAEGLIRRVIHPEEDIEARHLDEPERRWFYTMFLQSLGKYLNYKEERGERDPMFAYARASLLHYADWMATHEYPYLEKPEKLEFPTETWAAQEIRKSDAFYLAALQADGDDRARFVERGQFFFKTAIETLEQHATRVLARPVIVMLSSGLMHSWFQIHPAARAVRCEAHAHFGPHRHFVRQKAQAKQRLVWLGAAGIVVCVALAALLAVRYL